MYGSEIKKKRKRDIVEDLRVYPFADADVARNFDIGKRIRHLENVLKLA
jgi:hypothetical protein